LDRADGKGELVQGLFINLRLVLQHNFVDGIMPPPPVIAMGIVGFIVSVVSMYATGGFAQKLSMWYLLVISSLNAYIFLETPEVPLEDSFPDAVVGSEQYRPGIVYCEVVGFHFVMLALSCCPAPFGLAMAITGLIGGMAKHITVDELKPPLPVMGMAGGVFLACWYDVLTAGGHGANKTSKKSN
jgi:hypothetical protein